MVGVAAKKGRGSGGREVTVGSADRQVKDGMILLASAFFICVYRVLIGCTQGSGRRTVPGPSFGVISYLDGD